MSDNFLRILVLSNFHGRNANVIRDYLFSFNAHSKHKYFYFFVGRALDSNLDLSRFDVILLFWDLYLPGLKNPGDVYSMISQSPALKVLFLQDEYRDVRLFNEIMCRLGIQIMFSCVDEKDHELFYPHDLIPSLQSTYPVLTGYVPAYLEGTRPNQEFSRRIDIGYRSRVAAYYFGDLAQEKRIIAERFSEISREHGFTSDISVREEDRIYGQRWVEFLKSCHMVLGTPSGASVVDFSGEIARNCDRYTSLNPDAPYDDVKQRFFSEVDWKVTIDTVSPRIFEAASLGCTMVMHEGKYGNILKPGVHYIGVKKDYSNVSEVVAQMRDTKYRGQIAQNSYRDLIASGKFSYRTFIQRFDKIIDEHMAQPVRLGKVTKTAFYAQAYLRYGATTVPHQDHFHHIPLIPFPRLLNLPRIVIGRSIVAASYPELRILLCRVLANKLSKQSRAVGSITDLALLAILSRIRAGRRSDGLAYGIQAHFEYDSGKLLFVSHPGRNSYASEPVDKTEFHLKTTFPVSMFEAALDQGGVDTIVWDHSAVGTSITYPIIGWAKVRISMGLFGRYRFQGMSGLLEKYPKQTRAALVGLFDGGQDASQAGKTRNE